MRLKQAIRDGTVSLHTLAMGGILALTLRCLGAQNDDLRHVAYEAIALYAAALEAADFRFVSKFHA